MSTVSNVKNNCQFFFEEESFFEDQKHLITVQCLQTDKNGRAFINRLLRERINQREKEKKLKKKSAANGEVCKIIVRAIHTYIQTLDTGISKSSCTITGEHTYIQ